MISDELNDIDLAILNIETVAGDDVFLRRRMIEAELGWTTAYYEENVRCLITEQGSEQLAPGLVDVLAKRYPGPAQNRYWPDGEAFTRIDHV